MTEVRSFNCIRRKGEPDLKLSVFKKRRLSVSQIRTIIFVAILVTCFLLKIRLNVRAFYTSIDGGLYTNIAEHVRDGQGLVTDISPYHHGYSYFPHPTAIYPIWPLIYGYLARLVPLQIVGYWYPTLGYFVALAFAYLWGNDLARKYRDLLKSDRKQSLGGSDDSLKSIEGDRSEYSLPKSLALFTPGHALVLLLGLNRNFFQFTSLPYTEGIAYAFLFGALWRLNRIMGSRSLWHAIEMGTWVAALTLARSQFLIVGLALWIALGLRILHKPKMNDWARLGISIVVFFMLMGIQLYRISSYIPQNRLISLTRYDLAQANNLLSPVETMASPKGIRARFQDQLDGIKQAYSPFAEWSYARTYYFLPYLWPLAIILIARSIWNKRGKKRGLQETCMAMFADPSIGFLICLSAGVLISLNLMHLTIYREWYFKSRQALMALIPFFLGWILLAMRKRKGWDVLALFALFGTLVPSFAQCWNMPWVKQENITSRQLAPVVAWLSDQVHEMKRPVVAVPQPLPQLLAPRVSGASFHWIYEKTTEEELTVLFERLNTNFLILRDEMERIGLPFINVRKEWFEKYFKCAAEMPGFLVFVQR